MRRIFSIIAGLVSLLILLVGLGIFGLSRMTLFQTKHQATQAIAEGVSISLSRQMTLLQELVDVLAQSPEVVDTFSKGDPERLRQTALQMEKYIPGVLKIRLLLPGTDIPDSDSPLMGFADRDLVKESLTTHQLPAVHDQDANKHLAIAARTLKNNLAIGVVLASLDPALIQKSFQGITFNDGYLKLAQGDLVLFEKGDQALNAQDGSEVEIANTRWKLQFWSAKSVDMTLVWLISVIIISGLLLGCLCLFVAYRFLDNFFTKDCGTLLKVAKDLLNGKADGNYPANLAEMRVMISTLVQFRRVLDENGQEKPTSALNIGKLNDFLDEPEGFDFQYEAPPKSNPVQTLQEDSQGIQQHEFTSKQTLPVLNTVSQTASQSSIFKAFVILGIVDRTLTKDLVYNIGQAIGSEAKQQGIARIIMGYDGRMSSPSFAEAVSKGIIATGVNVIDIGMVPTPVMYFVAQHSEGRSGLMVTGGKHAAQYNGLKIMLNGDILIDDAIKKLHRRIDVDDYHFEDLGIIERNNRYTNEYIGSLADDIHIVRPMKVVVDCANGVTSDLAPKLFKTLGCEVIELFCDVDGNFPNHLPDSSRPENLSDLVAAVQHYHADVGITFDGDGSRLGVVDSSGKMIWPDKLMMLFAKDVLESKSGAQIIFDVSSSRVLSEQISKWGGRPVMARSGFAPLRAKVKETGARLAGDMSGHILFNDRWYGFDDALYAAARLIQILSADPRTSAELLRSFPETISTPELRIEIAEAELEGFFAALRKNSYLKNAKINDLDGLRIDFNDGWCAIRPAHSSPAILLRFEADSNAALERIQQLIKDSFLNTRPELNLPF